VTRTAALAAGVTLAAAGARAHGTWLVPTRSTVPPGVEVTFDLTRGAPFPGNASAIEPEHVTDARLRLGRREEALPLPPPSPGARSLRFRVPLRRPGIATLWVTLAPNDVELDSAQVAAYVAEIAAPDSVRRAYLARRAPRQWRERAAEHTKTFVRVTSPLRPAPAADTSWGEPTRAALELVPERDPTTLRAGDTLTVRVLRAGHPVFAFPVALVRAGAGRGVVRRAGPGGRVSFPLPRAGRWLLRATDLRRPRDADADVDWESDVATLTVVAR